LVPAVGPKPDTRTEERYAEQVEAFLEEAHDAMVGRALWELFRHSPALPRLQVSNPTDLGFAGVRLVGDVPEQVKGYPEELADTVEGDRADLPRPPKPLGTPRSVIPQLGAYNFASHIQTPVFSGPARRTSCGTRARSQSITNDFELRALPSAVLLSARLQQYYGRLPPDR
jgi:hypothetical protein